MASHGWCAHPVRVRALTGDIALCFLAKHLTFTAPLSAQMYKWVLAGWGMMKVLTGIACFQTVMD